MGSEEEPGRGRQGKEEQAASAADGPWESPPQPPLPTSSNPPARLASADLTPAVCLVAMASLGAVDLNGCGPSSDLHAAAAALTGMAGIATPAMAAQPPLGPHGDHYLHLGQRILSLYKQHHHLHQAQQARQARRQQPSPFEAPCQEDQLQQVGSRTLPVSACDWWAGGWCWGSWLCPRMCGRVGHC
jgi:hypothetical protein